MGQNLPFLSYQLYVRITFELRFDKIQLRCDIWCENEWSINFGFSNYLSNQFLCSPQGYEERNRLSPWEDFLSNRQFCFHRVCSTGDTTAVRVSHWKIERSSWWKYDCRSKQKLLIMTSRLFCSNEPHNIRPFSILFVWDLTFLFVINYFPWNNKCQVTYKKVTWYARFHSNKMNWDVFII